MKIAKILIIMLLLILSAGAVCAADTVSSDVMGNDSQEIIQTAQEDNTLETVQDDVYAVGDASFTELYLEIKNATGGLEIAQNYTFDNETDYSCEGISISEDNFVIEGNGYTIDGSNQSRIFIISAKNVTINNLRIVNANRDLGGAIFINSGFSLTTNNVVFDSNVADEGVVYVNGATYNSNNATFRNNAANGGIIVVEMGEYASVNDKFLDSTVSGSGVIELSNSNLTIDDALFMNSKTLSWGFIKSSDQSSVTVLNSIFRDTTSNYSAAIRVGGKVLFRNTKFLNLEALITAGAIALREFDECIIDNCTFVNVSSDKDGGAIFSDIIGNEHPNQGLLFINGTTFINCSSGFGGAILHLGSYFTIHNSKFIDNYATFDGGAVYVSNSNVSIVNSTFDNNHALYAGERGSFGGALYCDMSLLMLNTSNFTNNCAQKGSAIYLYDSEYNISKVSFVNNVNFNGSPDDIFTVFDGDLCILDNNTYSGEDSVSTDNVNYATIVDFEGMSLVILNNTIDVTTLPSRFDLRDWGWVTPVRNQGKKGACWTFGSSGAMESSILRFLGLEMDLSENNMEDLSLMYYMYGVNDKTEANSQVVAVNYALSWFGVFNEEYDVYDQLGKISPIFATNNSIHFQDVVVIPPRKNATDNDAIKLAILKYGALFIYYYADGHDVDQYYNATVEIDHGVSLVGWDDNREIAGAPGKGAWIIKNSWGTGVGEDGFMYISYYDTTLSTITDSFAFLLENTVPYNKNYQYDINGDLIYYNQSDSYLNAFVAIDDDLIAAVGTYFNDANVEYNIEIYVNDVLRLVQNGISPFSGFHTIKLDSYVPIKKGDEFTVKIKSNCVPLLVGSRQHYIQGSSQVFSEGIWDNITDFGGVCCLKAYTVVDDTKVINNKNIAVDYTGGKYFSVKVVTSDGHAVGAGEKVKFTINKKTTTVTTDKNGIAKIKITDGPGKYYITTSYKGKSVKNTVNVKHVITATATTVKKTAKSFTLKAKLKINGKLIKGKWITFKFNGKTYKAKTDKNGIAKVTVNKNVINKLKKGKTYSVVVTYSKDKIKSNVKVK